MGIDNDFQIPVRPWWMTGLARSSQRGYPSRDRWTPDPVISLSWPGTHSISDITVTERREAPIKKTTKRYFPGMDVSLERKEGEPVSGVVTRIDHNKIYVDGTPCSLKGLRGANIVYDAIREGYCLEVRR